MVAYSQRGPCRALVAVVIILTLLSIEIDSVHIAISDRACVGLIAAVSVAYLIARGVRWCSAPALRARSVHQLEPFRQHGLVPIAGITDRVGQPGFGHDRLVHKR